MKGTPELQPGIGQIRNALLAAMLGFATESAIAADAGGAAPAGSSVAQTAPSVKKVVALEGGTEATHAMTQGSRIRIVITGLPTDGKLDLQKLVPYLDGHAFKGVYPELVDAKNGILEFVLPRKVDAKDAWKPILRSPPWGGDRKVTIGVGPEDGREWPPADYKAPATLTFALFSGYWWILSMGIVIVGIALGWLMAKSGIVRDGTPPPSDPSKLPPFSLAKTQAAVWFFLVFAAFVFIWLMTGSFNGVMTQNTLALIGIGFGTSLGAAMVEVEKSDTEQKRREEINAQLQAARTQLSASPNAETQKKVADLEQLVQPASRGLVKDLLTDVEGITLHRFQMLVWTLTLGIVFIVGVYEELAMPQFDTPLLALMGISAGVYLGFKIPEKQI